MYAEDQEKISKAIEEANNELLKAFVKDARRVKKAIKKIGKKVSEKWTEITK